MCSWCIMCYGNKGNAHKASSRGSVLRIQVALRQGTQKRQRYATDVVENVYCRSVPARVRELQEKACQGRGQALTLGLTRRLFKRDISAHTLHHSLPPKRQPLRQSSRIYWICRDLREKLLRGLPTFNFLGRGGVLDTPSNIRYTEVLLGTFPSALTTSCITLGQGENR